jgi:hypothetical protein
MCLGEWLRLLARSRELEHCLRKTREGQHVVDEQVTMTVMVMMMMRIVEVRR